MSVKTRRVRMRRTQLSLLPGQYDKVNRMAKARGTSVSAVFRDLLDMAPDDIMMLDDPLRGIIGIVRDADPNGSLNVDQVLYDRDPHTSEPL